MSSVPGSLPRGGGGDARRAEGVVRPDPATRASLSPTLPTCAVEVMARRLEAVATAAPRPGLPAYPSLMATLLVRNAHTLATMDPARREIAGGEGRGEGSTRGGVWLDYPSALRASPPPPRGREPGTDDIAEQHPTVR